MCEHTGGIKYPPLEIMVVAKGAVYELLKTVVHDGDDEVV
jgi:hypothetical protein